MRITLDLPDYTRCLSVSIVYEGEDFSIMNMATRMIGSDELKSGGKYYVPSQRETEEEIEDD